MGKKGVIMDNGRTAQSSMALYWKKNKEVSKHPKQKKPEQDDNQITDKSVQSNFEKWKTHKQKLISKAYTKPKPNQATQKNTQNDKEQQELMEKLMESQKPKITTIPGFKSKNQLANKLQIEKPKEADQSTNVLRFPNHMQAMSQQQIVQMLRERKSKQQIQKRMEQHQNPQKYQKRPEKQSDDVMLMDSYIDLHKKKLNQEEKQPIEEEVKKPEPEPAFFKSDILNKIQKEGIEKVFVPGTKVEGQAGTKVEGQAVTQNVRENKEVREIKEDQQKQKKEEEKVQQIEVKKGINLNPKFLPRVLKK